MPRFLARFSRLYRPADALLAEALTLCETAPANAPQASAHAPDDGPFVGWFDSSYDLQNGLAVTEHAGLDDVPAQAMAVAWWDDCRIA